MTRPPLPAGRDLVGDELRALALWLRERPELWRAHVRHDPAQRTFHRLVADEHVTVWLICWMPGHDTGFHDHDGSAGAVAVLEGHIGEERLRLLDVPARAVYAPGDVLEFGAADIHRVRHMGTEPAVTLHAYSPALRRMGAYVADEEGRLLRHALDEETELRADAA
ncbi:MAG TPA: cysteine dioxygenase family protein [Solirubrobacteraceae bacterium]